jgi:hypothetical protein
MPGNEEWHDRVEEMFNSPPETIEFALQLVLAAHEASGCDRDLTTIAGSHTWTADQSEVYFLATALEEMVDAMERPKS